MFCFPMAGKSSRFFNAGFDKPKHQLTIGKKSVFELVINSFFEYFSSEQFIFICRDEYNNIIVQDGGVCFNDGDLEALSDIIAVIPVVLIPKN